MELQGQQRVQHPHSGFFFGISPVFLGDFWGFFYGIKALISYREILAPAGPLKATWFVGPHSVCVMEPAVTLLPAHPLPQPLPDLPNSLSQPQTPPGV